MFFVKNPKILFSDLKMLTYFFGIFFTILAPNVEKQKKHGVFCTILAPKYHLVTFQKSTLHGRKRKKKDTKKRHFLVEKMEK